MASKKYRVLLFSGNLGSRQAAKIRQGLLESGNVSSVEVCGFLRDVEPQPPFECTIFGKLSNRAYAGRICIYLKAFWWLLRNMRRFDVFITWTVDASAFLYISKLLSFSKGAFIYNVRDVHYLMTGNSIIGRIARWVDKFLSQHSDLILLTSPFYESEYYRAMLGIRHNRFQVLENKVPPETASKFPDVSVYDKKCENDKDIVIGYFGVFSYGDSIFDVIQKISQSGKKFYLRGYNYKGKSFLDWVGRNPNIKYGGGFKNPDDMGDMFGKVDMSWAINSAQYRPNTNSQWAMCNRFYEGLYFKKPLIVQDYTPAAACVKKYNIGLCVDNRNPEELVRKVSSITRSDILLWRKNIESLDKSVYLSANDEYAAAVEAAVRNAGMDSGEAFGK